MLNTLSEKAVDYFIKAINRPSRYRVAWQEYRHRSFAWKVRRRKRLDRNPLLVTIQDKLKVKQYARERGVESAEVYFVTDQPQTLPFDRLPENCFIKANHGCGWNIACIDSRLYRFANGNAFIRTDGTSAARKDIEKYSLTRAQCVDLCKKWLSLRYLANEWAYQDIEPKILVEEAFRQAGGGALRDYKIYVMDGIVKAICISGALFRINHVDRLFFDRNWNLFRETQTKPLLDEALYRRPDKLDEMIDAAERLGRGIDFIRADLYNTTRGVRLGEITLYPFAGSPGSPSSSASFNKWLGDQWNQPF
ncbi:MAG TPA: ATP-grasp fold amidoligase family protein [Smithellaceae bacterium]|nr:ATP-grasp fold amidoligase family protein [Smithellaceae bacterium]